MGQKIKIREFCRPCLTFYPGSGYLFIHSHFPLSLWKDDNIIISLNEERKACPLTTDSSVGHHQFKMIVPGRLTLKISRENFLNLSLYV